MLTKKDVFGIGVPTTQAFEDLKYVLCATPLLMYPDPSLPYTIVSDASGDVVGGVLMQDQGERLRLLMPFLQWFFIASLQLGFFPTQRKVAKVIALPKLGKLSYAEAHTYRPISMLNHFGKLLESIVNNRLKKWLEDHQLLSPFQWGFCLGRHVQVAYWRLVEEVTSAIHARDQVQVVALDIQATYDLG